MANMGINLHINLLKMFHNDLSETLIDIKEGRRDFGYASKTLHELDNLCMSTIEAGNRLCSGECQELLIEYEKIRAEVIKSLASLDEYARAARQYKQHLSARLN